MIWSTLRFIWQETLLELRRERLIAVTTISTVAVLLLLLGANLLFVLDLRVWAHRAEQEVQVTAYFQKDLGRADAESLAQTIAGWPEVQSARFVTREELWHELSTKVLDANRLRGLDASILSDSVRLQAKSASLVGVLSEKLKGTEGVKDVPGTGEEVQNGHVTGYVNAVMRFKRITGWAAAVVALLVALVGVFVVHNTIRLALHARWREIYLMQLVGATRSLVSSPFLLQGAIHGAIGALLASCLLVPLHMYLASLSARQFWRLQPDEALIPFTLYLILGGMLLGLLGSALSIRRTLRHRPEWES